MTTPGNYLDCEQGTDLWAKLRCGYVTASRAADVIAMKKQTVKQVELGIREELADRKNYRTELICERLSGIPYPHHVTLEMRWGLDHEDDAATAYELHAGELVDSCGFVIHPTVSMFGASPDRLVGEVGLLQIKCPTTKTHMEWRLAGTVPVEHMPQMLAEMSCTGRDWCDFVSYDPRLPDNHPQYGNLQLYVKRYHRNEKLIATLEAEVAHFNSEIDQVLSALPQKPQGIVVSMDQVNDDEVQF